jgi:hypothetical protein
MFINRLFELLLSQGYYYDVIFPIFIDSTESIDTKIDSKQRQYQNKHQQQLVLLILQGNASTQFTKIHVIMKLQLEMVFQ